MSYKALYRKYRPSTFEEVVGQKHVVMTLQNAVKNNKLAHAYLFCGPRGTGKTSVAKLLAKTINCTSENKPCGHCANCIDIQESTHPDVVELDAATNNGVDEVRELIEKVKYAPMQGKYKVYIIDEVHMMTPSAFNALLKTLEEPPEYCVFILATTEPHKVLPTIVSRCQRFDFNKVPVPVMKERLRYIVDKEGINCDDSALQLISELAEGGMRDALSVLDQCIAYAENNITAEDVSIVYGIATTAEKLELLKAVKDKDVQKTMSMVSDFSGRGIDLQRLTLDLINLAKEAVIYSYSRNKDLLEKATVDQVRELLNEYSSGELLKCIDYLMDTSGKYKDSSDSMSYLEVCLLKMMNVAGTMPQSEPIVRVVTETQPVKEETAEIEVQEEVEEVPVQIETPVVEEKKPVIRAIKNLSDENFYDILTKATKAIKEADFSNWQNVVNCREGKFMAVTSMLNGSKIMADSPKDIIVTVEERVVADNINELNNLALLEELVEKEFGVHKNVVAVTREQTEYLINYFRSRKSQPVQPVIKQEEPAVEEKPSTVDNLAKIFGQNGFDIVED
ncbi:MAG: DNA polymerase III subunit gamma/tau [Erysipelotrichaceae bacterium]|nr:DNA polymerase III subunit gamma/tau [Erysipelotrichaceae bacterium]